jgi:hypothetical protein
MYSPSLRSSMSFGVIAAIWKIHKDSHWARLVN